MPIGCPWVKSQRASVCKKEENESGRLKLEQWSRKVLEVLSYKMSLRTHKHWGPPSQQGGTEQQGWEPQRVLASCPEENLETKDNAWEHMRTVRRRIELTCFIFPSDRSPSLSWPTAVVTAFSRSSDTSLDTRERMSVTPFNRSCRVEVTSVEMSLKRGTSTCDDSCEEAGFRQCFNE